MAITTNSVSRVLSTLLILMFYSNAVAQSPRLSLDNGSVWARDLNPEVLYTFSRYFNTQRDWQAVFPITMKGNGNEIALSGDYKIFENAVQFTPRFPFAANVTYTANFFSDELALNANEIYLPKVSIEAVSLEFTTTPRNVEPPRLLAIHPTTDVIPENLLKIHLTFSKSMTIGEVYSKVKLFDADDQLVEKPFLVLDQELWDPKMTTVTVLFDPGRIKRGLRPNLEMKPALKAGQQYTLVVEAGWKDIDGQLTQESVTKQFRTTEADRQSPGVDAYQVNMPAHRNAPLILNLKEPHDRILLADCLRVIDKLGNEVEGILHVDNSDKLVQFVPKNPWLEMQYTIEVNPLLEDLAGNNLNRLFDEDLKAIRAKKQTVHRLSFKFSEPLH
jgi:hypothetical protein